MRLAKILEYHGSVLMAGMDFERMSDIDVMALFKQHFIGLLNKAKERINRSGPITKEREASIKGILEDFEVLIAEELDDMEEYVMGETEPDSWVHRDIKSFMEANDLHYEQDSPEYKLLKSMQKYARRSYFQELLAYNNKVKAFSLHTPSSHHNHRTSRHRSNAHKPAYQLQQIIDLYMDEEERKGTQASTNDDKNSCFEYLVELLGAEFPITKLDGEKARYVREQLLKTPKSRNTKRETRGLPLLRQIEIGQQANLETLSNTTINKYLTYYKSLLKWAVSLKYLADNPFDTMAVPNKKKNNRYEYFKKEQVATMLEELAKGKNGLADTETKYWGTLIAIYTGARRNEIASLMPGDIKEYEGIWYFDITDEEESKKIKTDAARRFVPVHSYLLDRGFLEYVEKARNFKPAPMHKGKTPRLLYDMTYHEKENWGRKLGRFVNELFLPKLALKDEKHVLHSLRHSFITYMNIAGVTPSSIKAIVGHEQGTVTEGTYTHYDVEHLPKFKEAIEKLPY
ncbi:MAG: site-specific integrase [Alphaproteobacteria bacterium]|nr:site-specific integrase [Alphaproteobacteria bacterium]